MATAKNPNDTVKLEMREKKNMIDTQHPNGEIKKLLFMREKLLEKFKSTMDRDVDLQSKHVTALYDTLITIREKIFQLERRLKYLGHEIGEKLKPIFVTSTGFEPLNELISAYINDPATSTRPLTTKTFSRLLNQVKEEHGEGLMIQNQIPLNNQEDLYVYIMCQIQNITRLIRLHRVQVPMFKKYHPEDSNEEFIAGVLGSMQQNKYSEEIREALKESVDDAITEDYDDCCDSDEEEKESDLDGLNSFLYVSLNEMMDGDDEFEFNESENRGATSSGNINNDCIKENDIGNNKTTIGEAADSNKTKHINEITRTKDFKVMGPVPRKEFSVVPFDGRKRPGSAIASENVKRPNSNMAVVTEIESENTQRSPINLTHVNIHNTAQSFSTRPQATEVITLSDSEDDCIVTP